MFSTLFYVLILLYQNLFSVGNDLYNNKIAKINTYIKNEKYAKAFDALQEIERSDLFTRRDIQEIKTLLSIKLHRPLKFESEQEDLNHTLVNSFVFAQSNDKILALKELKAGINIFQDSDTLIKVFEIYSNQPINKGNASILKVNQNINNQRNVQINTNEAVILLNLMRKKEKILTN